MSASREAAALLGGAKRVPVGVTRIHRFGGKVGRKKRID
jgi:hypothetical protein